MRSKKDWTFEQKEDQIRKSGMGMMLLLLFLFLAAAMIRPSCILIWAVIYGALNFVTTAVMYRASANRTNAVLEKISFLIEELISGRKEKIFPVAEDNLLSKLQVQLLKLYEILHSYEEREQKLREQLSGNIGDLVHQINTPITNIELYTHFLENEEMEAEERIRFIKRIQEQAQKLIWLGEGFSKASRLETGIIQLKTSEQKLFPVLLQAVDQVMLKAEEKEMNISVSGDKSSIAVIDSKWSLEAVYNVLDNAVKYGYRNTEIEIELTDMVSFVRVAVKNKGIPIRKEEFNLVFTRFYRGKEGASREGVGLGLYLAREILTGQKGYIKVLSDLEGKTVFELYFYKGSKKDAISLAEYRSEE